MKWSWVSIVPAQALFEDDCVDQEEKIGIMSYGVFIIPLALFCHGCNQVDADCAFTSKWKVTAPRGSISVDAVTAQASAWHERTITIDSSCRLDYTGTWISPNFVDANRVRFIVSTKDLVPEQAAGSSVIPDASIEYSLVRKGNDMDWILPGGYPLKAERL